MKSSLRRKRRYSAAIESPLRLTVKLSSYYGSRNRSIKRSQTARTPTRRLENTPSKTLLAGSSFILDEWPSPTTFESFRDFSLLIAVIRGQIHPLAPLDRAA